MYQLRVSKRNTANLTPIEAHFGRKANTPLSNISKVSKSSNFLNENILNYYLDADTVPVDDYLIDKSDDRSYE